MAPSSNYRDDIVDIVGERFSEYAEVRQGKMFGHPGFSIIGRFFCFAYEDGMAIKLSPADYARILESEEAEKFKPGGSPMGTWAVLTYIDAEEYLEHWEWLEKAMAYIVTDEAAPPKKRKKSTTRK